MSVKCNFLFFILPFLFSSNIPLNLCWTVPQVLQYAHWFKLTLSESYTQKRPNSLMKLLLPLCCTHLHFEHPETYQNCCFLRHTIGFKNSRHFFIQSEVKPKPIVTHWHVFSCALRQLPVITSSFDWFTVLSVSFVIG